METKENGNLLSSSGYPMPEEFMYFNEPFESSWKNVRLSLLQQPELQHRARYLTEGSRGPIKNRNFDGYPTIQVRGGLIYTLSLENAPVNNTLIDLF